MVIFILGRLSTIHIVTIHYKYCCSFVLRLHYSTMYCYTPSPY